jgi:hypothetical protein
MPLEGLRAWIGEVERKLGMRTRVFLVLSVIALGGAGAAIYLAIDARESSVSESDVQALQERLEARIDESAGGAATVPEEPVEPAPAPEPEPESGAGKQDGAPGGAATQGAGGDGASAPGGASGAESEEPPEQAKDRNAQAEKEQAQK